MFACVVLVLFGIDSEALSNKINVDAVNMLNQSRDRRHNLLRNVPLVVDVQFSACSHKFIRTESLFSQTCLLLCGRFRAVNITLFLCADEVRNKVVNELGVRFAVGLHSECDLNMGQRTNI